MNEYGVVAHPSFIKVACFRDHWTLFHYLSSGSVKLLQILNEEMKAAFLYR